MVHAVSLKDPAEEFSERTMEKLIWGSFRSFGQKFLSERCWRLVWKHFWWHFRILSQSGTEVLQNPCWILRLNPFQGKSVLNKINLFNSRRVPRTSSEWLRNILLPLVQTTTEWLSEVPLKTSGDFSILSKSSETLQRVFRKCWKPESSLWRLSLLSYVQ
jgi:hypothetical protein